MEKVFSIRLSESDYKKIDEAREFMGLHSRSEFVRFLLTEYLKDWYDYD